MGEDQAAVDRLVALLEVEQLDLDLFRAPAVAGEGAAPPRRRLFGGQVAGQTLRAATKTVADDRSLHSMHCYFLRMGDPGQPLYFYVDRSRDGGSFTTRHVAARQKGETIFELIASFHRDETGDEYELPRPASADPSALSQRHGWEMPHGDGRMFDAFDVAVVDPDDDHVPHLDRSTLRYWVRTRDRLPDEPGLHASVAAFVSDMRAATAAMATTDFAELLETQANGVQVASLDHAMWFHRPVRADDWLLVDVHPVAVSGSRGFMVGTIHDAAGTHGVSFTQEVLLRRPTA